MQKIIAFSGRLGSGKTELARICEKMGYIRLPFALPLKTLVAHIIGVDVSEINDLKNVQREYNLGAGEIEYISQETDIPIDIIREKIESQHFTTVRQLLQYIGTDIIRAFNNNWHIEKTRDIILSHPENNYVIDDLRFPNEKKMVEDLGGDTWFIVRPKLDNVSHHLSEEALKWQDFDYHLIPNDESLETFTTRWQFFFENYDKSSAARENEVDKYLDDPLPLMNQTWDALSPMSLLELSKDFFLYKPHDFNDIKALEPAKDGRGIFITYNDGTKEIIYNILLVEDLKKYVNYGNNS